METIFNLWLIGGLIVSAIAISYMILFCLLIFGGKKITAEEWIKEYNEQNMRYKKAKYRAGIRPEYEMPESIKKQIT